MDTMVFTGGIGENSSVIRSRVCQDASWLGVEIDETANTKGHGCISKGTSRVAVWVIPTNEELMIARHTLHLLKTTSGE
jgi:acetate kinase